jgi:antirestriction protein ArdC
MFDLFGTDSTLGQTNLSFPQSLTEKYRPRTMAEFVGLAKPKAICASLAARPFESGWVFVENLAANLPLDPTIIFEPIPAAQELAESYLTRANIELHHGGDRAFYHPGRDFIQMPAVTAFELPDAYYSTLFHECGHSTGHESRLDRKLTGGQTFGSEDYSKEELVAEFAAAFLCAETGISNERVSTNHLAYIQGWMRALKNDKTMLVSAAQKAQRAADLILDRAAGAAAQVETAIAA